MLHYRSFGCWVDAAYGLKDDGDKSDPKAWYFSPLSSSSESEPAIKERDLVGDKSRSIQGQSEPEWLKLTNMKELSSKVVCEGEWDTGEGNGSVFVIGVRFRVNTSADVPGLPSLKDPYGTAKFKESSFPILCLHVRQCLRRVGFKRESLWSWMICPYRCLFLASSMRSRVKVVVTIQVIMPLGSGVLGRDPDKLRFCQSRRFWERTFPSLLFYPKPRTVWMSFHQSEQ